MVILKDLVLEQYWKISISTMETPPKTEDWFFAPGKWLLLEVHIHVNVFEKQKPTENLHHNLPWSDAEV